MDIVKRVQEAGVVGAGGAGYPTHSKLQARVDTVIVNGAECEPLLESDLYLMERESGKVVRGLEYMMKCLGAVQGYIAMKEKHTEPFSSMTRALGTRKDMRLVPLGDYYPAGDEFMLVYDVTGRIVPEAGIPPDVGCMVDNVETVVNVCEAVELQRPVTNRFLTCTGEVRYPSVVHVHLGTTLSEVIDLCGGATVEDPVAVLGGPLMGEVVTDMDSPVTKTTSGILVLPRDHRLVQTKTMSLEFIIRQCKSVCCQCTLCTELCPRHLLGHDIEPHLIMRQIGYGLDVPARIIENALLCSGCGLCAVYACTMGLSPHVVNKTIKKRLQDQGYRRSADQREIRVNEMKDYRKIPASRIVQRLQLNSYAERRLRRVVETDPERVEIPLSQHIGRPSEPLVQEGELVHRGDLIARVPEGALGAAIHASIDGRVILVDDERVIIERRG
jgi:Na+-translocating ferredoxin:NAD+ oxidoreductase RnfC subunit